MEQNLGGIDEHILLKIYDTVRYVKPIEKKCSANGVNFGDNNGSSHCFAVWEKNQVCQNCISMRALKEKKTIMKLEYSDNKIFMVTAVPMNEYENDNRVIELIRDVTHENLMESKDLVNEAAISEKINRLNRELISDPLTQLYNRRFMDERLPYELVRSWIKKLPMSLVMADIDFFKKVNDTYGHLAGDQVLIEFSSILQSMIRENQDWVIRYGGEEFLIFISDMNKELLLKKIELIRAAVENREFTTDEGKIRLTSSFGVFSIIPDHADDIEITKTYISNADKALYHSKKTGRNKVSYFGDFE